MATQLFAWRAFSLRLWILAVATLCACNRSNPSDLRPEVKGTVPRIISLSPAITETLFALGVGDKVVGVSDFCHAPSAVDRLPRVGSVFSPRLEAIVALEPSVVLADRIEGPSLSGLSKLVKVVTFPWLSYEDVIESTRSLGTQFGCAAQAQLLIARYEAALAVRPAPNAPKVLLALSHVPGQLNEVYFIRKNSIHGRALEATGATNAVVREVNGPPRLSLEQVIATDPDAIFVLEPSEQQSGQLLEDWRKLTGLRAIRDGKLAWVGAPEAEVPGPRIVRLVERLRAALTQLDLRNGKSQGTQR